MSNKILLLVCALTLGMASAWATPGVSDGWECELRWIERNNRYELVCMYVDGPRPPGDGEGDGLEQE